MQRPRLSACVRACVRVSACRGADSVPYSVGSTWVQVSPGAGGQDTFEVVDSDETVLATATGYPPASPSAATLFFYGVAETGTSAKLLNDAPEALERDHG
jgi:hypothetical protein